MAYLSSFVTYIRVSDYIASYMRCTYGGPVLTFSDVDPFYTCVSQNLIENIGLSKHYTSLSYTQRAVDIAKKERNDGVCNTYAVPKQGHLTSLVAVYLPQRIYRKGGVDQPSSHYQLTRRGAQDFRKLAKMEFWSDLILTMKREMVPDAEGKLPQKRALLAEFMRVHHIKMDHLESIYRHLPRNIEKLKRQNSLKQNRSNNVK